MAPKAQNAGKPSIPANQTLYVANLPEKLQKQDLRRELYMLFSTYGSVLSIVALKTSSMRGQAHITFKDAQTATQAMRNLHGSEFFGRPMRIQYAKSKSDFIAKLDGTFKMPETEAAKAAAAELAAGEKGTALQQSVFGRAPPGSAVSTTPAPGLKRARDEEDEDMGEAPMEEDEEDMEMEESDED